MVGQVVQKEQNNDGKCARGTRSDTSAIGGEDGEKARLVRVEAGRGLNSRLASMGFVPKVEITVVSNGHPGPFVVVIKDVKLALGRGVAHRIMVEQS